MPVLPCVGIQISAVPIFFNVPAEDLNSCLHAFVVSTLVTEPSPQPQSFKFLLLSFQCSSVGGHLDHVFSFYVTFFKGK